MSFNLRIVLLIISRLPEYEEPELKCFLKSVFQTDSSLRPTAEKCLEMDFFKKRHTNNSKFYSLLLFFIYACP